MQARTEIFSHRVADYMRREPVVLSSEATVSELLAAMTAAGRTSALVVDAAGSLSGIVTEQDVTRRIALRARGEEVLANVMTRPVTAIQTNDFLYCAIARMRRYGWRHMPVIDREARPVGIIELHRALSVASQQILHEIDLVTRDDSLDGLREIKAAQVELATSLLADQVPAPEVQAVLSHINCDLHVRILERHLAELRALGAGDPPVDFALLIMGSGGRGESFLHPDQDNGFILADYPDAEHERIDGFFIELAERMTHDLDAVGFPYCSGYVMATNPLWRKTLSQWRAQVQLWGRRRHTIAIQLADIFFDFEAVYGRVEMAGQLRAEVSQMAKNSPAFLADLCEEMSRTAVALGWFGRLLVEKGDPEHRGKINMKHRGTLPLVSYLRLLALKAGVTETSTLARIKALHGLEVLSDDEADYLSGAFHHITSLLLRQQLTDFKAGQPVGNYVHPDSLSERDRDILVDSFKAIDGFGERIKSEFTGELF